MAYAITNPGVNALRNPVYKEMVNIVNGKDVTFSEFKFNRSNLISTFKNTDFLNQRQITRSMVTWWAFQFEEQELIPIDLRLDIEHIYARNRTKQEPLEAEQNTELLGNKSLLEQRINIRASDYRFSDKVKHYRGELSNNSNKSKTSIYELIDISNKKEDFREEDILKRNEKIIKSFCDYLTKLDLMVD